MAICWAQRSTGRGSLSSGINALVTLHPRHVGVAEDSDAFGPEAERLARRSRHALGRLQGEAVDEVEIERTDAERPRRVGAGFRFLIGLFPADRLLDRGLEILDAEADPRHPNTAERLPAVGRERRRIDLDGDLRIVSEGKAPPEPLHDADQAIRR